MRASNVAVAWIATALITACGPSADVNRTGVPAKPALASTAPPAATPSQQPAARQEAAPPSDEGGHLEGHPLAYWLENAESEIPHVQARAIEVLGTIRAGQRALLPDLSSALKSHQARANAQDWSRWKAGFAVASAMSRFGKEGGEAVPFLTAILRSNGWPHERRQAAEALSRVGTPEAGATLAQFLYDTNYSSYDDVTLGVDSLKAMGAEGSRAVVQLANSPAVNWCRGGIDNLMRALEAIGPVSDDAIPVLVLGLRDRDELNCTGMMDTRHSLAASALGAYGRRAEAAVPALVALTKSGGTSGTAAARALERIVPAP